MTRTLTLVCLLAALASRAGAADSLRVSVTVDPRIELLTAVQCLAGAEDLGHFDLAYRREILQRFGPWRAHRVVALLAAMRRAGFTREAPAAVVLRLADPPGLELRAPLTASLEARAGGREQLFAFLYGLRDFAAETGFMAFYEEHAALYRRLCAQTERSLRRTRVVSPLEEYFGARLNGYHLMLAPLLPSGGYGAEVVRPPGRVDGYAILGPSGVRADRPRFWGPDDLEALLWHEFGHTFVGNLPDSCRGAIAADSALFPPLRARMEAQGYSRWETCADEHLVRAVGVRLVARLQGSRAGERTLDRQLRLGFAYLPGLLIGLERYERERDLFPTLGDFCPELAAALDRRAARQLPRP